VAPGQNCLVNAEARFYDTKTIAILVSLLRDNIFEQSKLKFKQFGRQKGYIASLVFLGELNQSFACKNLLKVGSTMCGYLSNFSWLVFTHFQILDISVRFKRRLEQLVI
jgi:hypothetical protein